MPLLIDTPRVLRAPHRPNTPNTPCRTPALHAPHLRQALAVSRPARLTGGPALRRLSATLACTLLYTLAGCVMLPPPRTQAPAALPASAPVLAAVPPAPAPPPAPDPAALADAATRRLLAFHERLRELAPAELAREQLRIGEAPDQPALQLELVLLLAQRQQPGDVARALALIEPHARAQVPNPWQAAARLLQTRLAEQRKLEEQLEKQTVQLRDQQRRLEQLAAQLEALKAIERSLNNPRPAPPAAPAAPAAPSPRPAP